MLVILRIITMENEKLITGDELRTMNLPLKAGKDLYQEVCV